MDRGPLRDLRVLLQGCGPPVNGGKQPEGWKAVPGKSEPQGRAGEEAEAGSRKVQLCACHCCSQCPGMTAAGDGP